MAYRATANLGLINQAFSVASSFHSRIKVAHLTGEMVSMYTMRTYTFTTGKDSPQRILHRGGVQAIQVL